MCLCVCICIYMYVHTRARTDTHRHAQTHTHSFPSQGLPFAILPLVNTKTLIILLHHTNMSFCVTVHT